MLYGNVLLCHVVYMCIFLSLSAVFVLTHCLEVLSVTENEPISGESCATSSFIALY